MNELSNNNEYGIELYRIGRLQYQLIDSINNKEAIFINILNSDTEEDKILKIYSGKSFLLAKRK